MTQYSALMEQSTSVLLDLAITPTMDSDVLRVLVASKKKLEGMKSTRKWPSLRKHHLVTTMLQKARRLEAGDSGPTSATDRASSGHDSCGPSNRDDDPWAFSEGIGQRPSALEHGICPTPKRPDN